MFWGCGSDGSSVRCQQKWAGCRYFLESDTLNNMTLGAQQDSRNTNRDSPSLALLVVCWLLVEPSGRAAITILMVSSEVENLRVDVNLPKSPSA